MLRSEPARPPGSPAGPPGFLLYLEGPADRAVVQGWCRRLEPRLVRSLSRATVILGGRRPARAVEHFRRHAEPGWRGLCVLDRDGGSEPEPPIDAEPRLEFHTWGRRHIESYLLVPAAISRALRLPARDSRAERSLRALLPAADDESALRELDAKKLLAPGGPLARALGRPIPLDRVARATREGELAPEVHEFLTRLRRLAGTIPTEVVR